MIRTAKAIFLTVVFFLQACGGGSSESSSFAAGSFSTSFPRAQVEFEFDKVIKVVALVNGIRGVFVLDTGADIFTVSQGFATRLGLESYREITLNTIAGTSAAPVAKLDSFVLGNVVGQDIDAIVIDFPEADGIIGLPFFRELIVSIDFLNEELLLESTVGLDLQAKRLDIGGEIVFAPNFSLADVRVEGVNVERLRIDTGSGGGVRLSGAVGQQALSSAEQTLSVVSTAVNGTVEGTAFIARSLEIANFAFENQFVVIQGTEIPFGLIGNLVLQQFFVVLDLSRNEVLLRKDRNLQFTLNSTARTDEELGSEFYSSSNDIEPLLVPVFANE